jgi:hypothetical protein
MPIDPSALEPGERILWSGRPNALRTMQARSGLTTMAGFALLIASEFLTQAGHDGRLPPWIATIVLFAAVVMLLLPLFRAWRARNTDYAVTDRRALKVIRARFRSRDAVALSEIASIELRPRPRGVSDVLMIAAATGSPRLVFECIADADKVQALLRTQIPNGR